MPAVSTQQLAFDLVGAARSAIPFTWVHLSVQHEGGDTWNLEALARDLSWHMLEDGKSQRAEGTVMAVCLSAGGSLLGRTFTTPSFTTTRQGDDLLRLRAPFAVKLTVPKGTTRIRFVYRDSTGGQIGTVNALP